MGARYRPSGAGARGDAGDRGARPRPPHRLLVGVEGAGDEGEQVPEHRAGGPPDRVADDLEEVDRPVLGRDAPALLAEHAVGEQLRERHVQHQLDLPRARPPAPGGPGRVPT